MRHPSTGLDSGARQNRSASMSGLRHRHPGRLGCQSCEEGNKWELQRSPAPHRSDTHLDIRYHNQPSHGESWLTRVVDLVGLEKPSRDELLQLIQKEGTRAPEIQAEANEYLGVEFFERVAGARSNANAWMSNHCNVVVSLRRGPR
jgi:hypothetical protein